MGYFLQAYIGKTDNIRPIADRFQNAVLVELNQGFSLIPMIDDLYKEIINQIPESKDIGKFELLKEEMEKMTLNIIKDSKFAYVESEFFGGQGGHSGIIWENGKRIYEGEFAVETMNTILHKLGVRKFPLTDEFSVLDLGRHRSTDKWIE